MLLDLELRCRGGVTQREESNRVGELNPRELIRSQQLLKTGGARKHNHAVPLIFIEGFEQGRCYRRNAL